MEERPVHNAILNETIARIGEILGPELDAITIERGVIGLFFTGVQLGDGIVGTCATPIKSIPEAVCCPSSAMAMPFPGKLKGRRAADLLREVQSDHGIRRAVGIATMNALAELCWQRCPHPDFVLRTGVDAFDATEFRPGDRTVVAETPWGRLGMSVCYDVRFPHLYRALAQAGADFLSVPSVFTVPTGRAHWHVLLRARAIENGCFVFAPAQWGEHTAGRKSYGHSLIVDPWGEVLADGGEEVGFVTAKIEPARIAEARRSVPSLTHDRPFTPPALAPRSLAAE